MARAVRTANHPQGQRDDADRDRRHRRQAGAGQLRRLSRATWSTCPREAKSVYRRPRSEIAQGRWTGKPSGIRTAKARPRARSSAGLGMAIHTWAGGGHASSCLVRCIPTAASRRSWQPGSRHRHADGDRHGGGRNVRAAAIGGESEHRQLEVSGAADLRGAAHRGRRGRVTAPRCARLRCAELCKLAANKLKVDAGNLVARGGRIEDKQTPARA